jgi:hypothetical protein
VSFLVLVDSYTPETVFSLDGLLYEDEDEARDVCEHARAEGWDAFVVTEVDLYGA